MAASIALGADSATAESSSGSFDLLYAQVVDDGNSNEASSGTPDAQQDFMIIQSAIVAQTYVRQPSGLRPFSLHGESAMPTTKYIYLPGGDDGRWTGQCVGWVQYQTGWNITGNAITWKEHINSEIPEVNAVVVLNLSSWGHVGIVIDVDMEARTFTYRSRNQDGWAVISDNTISFDDPMLLGFIIADAI